MNAQTLPISTRARLVSESEAQSLLQRQEQVREELEAKGLYLVDSNNQKEEKHG